VTRCGLLLCLLFGAAALAEDVAAIRARMADIETRLACGATGTDTVYVYQDGPFKAESMSLAPWILQSDSGLRLVATPHHPLARGVDSVYVLSSLAEEATIVRKAGTGADDFVTNRAFRSVILNAPKDAEVRVRLCGTSTFIEFSMSNRERQDWRKMAYYMRNFELRTHSLPDTSGSRPERGPTGCFPMEVKPKLLDVPAPYYPEQLKRSGIEGTVLVEALLDTVGAVLTVLIYRSSGHEPLDEAAVRAALDATFTPARQRDKPVRTWVTLPYRFRLP